VRRKRLALGKLSELSIFNFQPFSSQDVRAAVDARQRLADDFFGGWEPSDVDLFRRYLEPSSPTPGKITDFLGIKTSTEFVPWASRLSGTVNQQIPIPDDGVRAEAIEYFALLDAIECASPGCFTFVELGASYGPWTCASAVLAKRAGRTTIRLVAVEASSFLFALIPQHLEENEIKDTISINIRLVHGAVSNSLGDLYFPKVHSASENGGQVVDLPRQRDYVGRSVEYERVASYLLPDLLPDGITDFLHVDIQGAESPVLAANASLINDRVRSVFVGVHSRKIEGELLEFFHSSGWVLRRERPTKFAYHGDRENIVGWTSRDGGQYWRNPRLS
jgi:FkbM family methyltransferase